jgi:hypothetical protein
MENNKAARGSVGNQKWLVVLIAGLLLSACSGKKVKLNDGNKVSKNGVVLWASWIKDKGKKFDLQLNLLNETKKSIIINLSDMSCFRGSLQGELKHTFFNTGERTIDLGVGLKKSFNMVCNYGEKASGNYKIVISQVFENPGSDGKTRGAVIANNLEWVATGAD